MKKRFYELTEKEQQDFIEEKCQGISTVVFDRMNSFGDDEWNCYYFLVRTKTKAVLLHLILAVKKSYTGEKLLKVFDEPEDEDTWFVYNILAESRTIRYINSDQIGWDADGSACQPRREKEQEVFSDVFFKVYKDEIFKRVKKLIRTNKTYNLPDLEVKNEWNALLMQGLEHAEKTKPEGVPEGLFAELYRTNLMGIKNNLEQQRDYIRFILNDHNFKVKYESYDTAKQFAFKGDCNAGL